MKYWPWHLIIPLVTPNNWTPSWSFISAHSIVQLKPENVPPIIYIEINLFDILAPKNCLSFPKIEAENHISIRKKSSRVSAIRNGNDTRNLPLSLSDDSVGNIRKMLLGPRTPLGRHFNIQIMGKYVTSRSKTLNESFD